MMRDALRCGPIPCRSDKLSRFTARMVPGSTASVRRPLEGQPPPNIRHGELPIWSSLGLVNLATMANGSAVCRVLVSPVLPQCSYL
jgi:hypothetical protein